MDRALAFSYLSRLSSCKLVGSVKAAVGLSRNPEEPACSGLELRLRRRGPRKAPRWGGPR
jgi:hypothetical protein